jgi:threonine synthase
VIDVEKILKLVCVKCGAEYAEEEVQYVCPKCGIEGILDVIYDYELIAKELTREYLLNNREPSIKRYFPILPVEKPESFEPLQVGSTPIYEVKKLRQLLELDNLYVKDDSRNPTLSFKDRASAVGIAKAKELKRDIIAAASTGNAASSISGFAASAGMKSVIFVPKTAPEAKVTQLLIFGSTVFLVDGTYDEAVELCFKACEEFGWYNRSCAINPYLVEGKKTVAFEIIEQLDFRVPDYVVMSVGDGCSISGAYKGFVEFHRLGLIDRVPKMIGIQAENSNPVTRAYNNNTYEFEYRRPDTIADSISVGIPRNGIKALNAIVESGGYMLDVSDEEILEAIRFLASNTGIFGEPAGVTGFAGIRKLRKLGLINKEDLIVTVVTGSGLKDLKAAQMAAPKAHKVSADIRDLVELFKKFENKVER